MMLKVFFLAVVCFMVADARRLTRFFWDDDSDIQKRSYARQVCTNVMKEEVVSTSTLLNKVGSFYPDEVRKLSCKTENELAAGVSDSSIICKTKKRSIDVFEFNDKGHVLNLHKVVVPEDCVAYKI